jgi:hypothetical protein
MRKTNKDENIPDLRGHFLDFRGENNDSLNFFTNHVE